MSYLTLEDLLEKVYDIPREWVEDARLLIEAEVFPDQFTEDKISELKTRVIKLQNYGRQDPVLPSPETAIALRSNKLGFEVRLRAKLRSEFEKAD